MKIKFNKEKAEERVKYEYITQRRECLCARGPDIRNLPPVRLAPFQNSASQLHTFSNFGVLIRIVYNNSQAVCFTNTTILLMKSTFDELYFRSSFWSISNCFYRRIQVKLFNIVNKILYVILAFQKYKL